MDASIEFTGEAQAQPLEVSESFVDKRIDYLGEHGTIKYSGPLRHQAGQKQDSNQIWLGIQWDDAYRGKHNGTVEGYTYFSCDDGCNSGSLLKLDKANFGQTIYDGIHYRYFNTPVQSSGATIHSATTTNSHGDSVEVVEEVYFETIKKFKKKVEFIGFERIWKKINDLKNIRELSLPNCKISDIGPDGYLKQLLPKLRTLSLENNLLHDWNQVYLIGRELPYLEELSISGNRLKEPEENVADIQKMIVNSNGTIINESPLNVFQNLKTIIMISMRFTWKSIEKILPLFFQVRNLVLCYNQLNDFENLSVTGSQFKNLDTLNLEGNSISSFEGIMKFNDAPYLRSLILSKNELQEVGEVSGFNNLRTIIMEDNKVSNFKIFSQLNRFPVLERLRITKNPIYAKHKIEAIRTRVIAEVKSLKVFNGGELKKYERKDCEIYYLRNAFHEFFTQPGQSSYEYDFDIFEKYAAENFPRVPELMKTFGNPYEEGIKNRPKVEAPKPKMASLINIKLTAFSGPGLGKPSVNKKFTDNTLITNLKAMLAKQFGISANKQKIYFKKDPKEPFIPLNEDLRDIKSYGVKEGSEIWVGDTDL